jgi:DNA-binding transcriptional LysR family regulator
MELQHFRCFIVLAEELHFRRAADRLHLSQPHLTRLIAQIEAELTVKLLHRTTRQVSLTDAGQQFLIEAKAVLARVDQAIQVTRDQPTALGIAFTEMARHCIVPKVLAEFRDRYPDIKLTILEACTEEQVEALHDRKIDIGFLHPPLRSQSLEVFPLYQERFMVALPIGHPLAVKSELAIADLSNETLILYDREHGPVLYDYVLQLCGEAGFTPNICHLESGQTLLSLVTAKIGVCFLAPSMQSATNSGIVCLPIAGEAPVLEYALAWRREEQSDTIAVFLDLAKQSLTNS